MTDCRGVAIDDRRLAEKAKALFGLTGYAMRRIEGHEGGRNIVFQCEKAGDAPYMLRVSVRQDRSREDVLAELEFVNFLFAHGAGVSPAIPSLRGNLAESFTLDGRPLHMCLFRKAKGKTMPENHYRYREGAPLAEYFFQCGKTLGKIHHLSKAYVPVHRRHGFFDKCNASVIDELVPDDRLLLKDKMKRLLTDLEGLERSRDRYGLVHFDFNDGNYAIDFATGAITVYDFDNACSCWYTYDLADLWTNGTGWIAAEPDAGKRKAFMEDYFNTALAGYRSETAIDKALLAQLPLFLQVTLMENILDAFAAMRDCGEEPEVDEELAYLIKCMEEDIPYRGFFHEIYNCEEPFAYKK